MKFFVGMSGWTYPDWRGNFYPKGVVQKKELEYCSRQVSSIEINGTFYRMQKPDSFRNWYAATPEDFVFSLKAPQYITHIRRLKEIETPVINFIASGIFCLKEKLGPILWQFPPNMMLKDDRFDKLIKLLPKTPAAASKLSKKHSDWLDQNETSSKGVKQIRHAFEFRHPSFFNDDFLAQLKENGIAAVFAHAGKKDLPTEVATADFAYCRMHGEGKEYAKGYPAKTLKDWKKKLEAHSKQGVKEAFVYFDTSAKDYAPQDALNFLKLVRS